MDKKSRLLKGKQRLSDGERARLLEYLLVNPDRVISNAELREMLGPDRSDSWIRRLRELREPRFGGYVVESRRERPGLQKDEYFFPAQQRRAPAPSARISNSLRIAVFDRDAYTCQHCGLTRGERYENGRSVTLQVGHNLADSHGGKASLENCVTYCGRCNEGESNVGPDRPTVSKTLAQVKKLPNHERREIYDFLKRVFEK